MCRKYSKNSELRLGAPPACERWKCSARGHRKFERDSGGDDLVSEQLRGEWAERERAAVSDALLESAHEGTRCNFHLVEINEQSKWHVKQLHVAQEFGFM